MKMRSWTIGVLFLTLGLALIEHVCGATRRSTASTRRRESTAKRRDASPPPDNQAAMTAGRHRRIKKATRIPRIQQEIISFNDDPTNVNDGLYAELIDDNIYNWLCSFTGPPDSPYEGGRFWVKLTIPPDYPNTPPKVRLLTKTYHPNISGTDICVDFLKTEFYDWNPTIGIAGVLRSLRLLLETPNPDDPLSKEAAVKYTTDRDAFNRQARSWTTQYAKLNQKPSISSY